MIGDFSWDIFLSYSSRDKERVRRLAERLRDKGLRVWFDEWEIKYGDDIYFAIEDGLGRSRVLILCLSQAALDSEWIMLERNTRLFSDPQNKERRFIPVLLEDCQPPDTIRRFHCADWRNESDETLGTLFQHCQPPPQQKAKTTLHHSRKIPTLLTGTMNPDNPFYIRRESDRAAIVTAYQLAETIIIKAPRQMGKSSLLLSYLAACQESGKKTVRLDLASWFAKDERADFPTLLTLLAKEMWEHLGCPSQAEPGRINNQREMSKYVGRVLLKAIDVPVVFAFDKLECVLGQNYQSDFFSMLRDWHNQRADTVTNWTKLGLALIISTEPLLFIKKDDVRSPFNVGIPIELRYFNETECEKLNRLYRARLSKAELKQLMALVNGHPQLLHLAFYSLTSPNKISFPALLQRAAEIDGPFGSHLRAVENKLMDEAGQRLLTAMKQVIKGNKEPSRDVFYHLHGAGLVREDGCRTVPVNQLYIRFFGKL